MNIQETNYWLETVCEPARGSGDPLPESVDVAVVGAGFCGLSAARVLAKRGVGVAVLEAETLGWGASCRNGGMVLTGMKLPVPTLIARYGRETVRKMYAASLESIDVVEQIVREEGIECAFSRCGHLEVACKAAHGIAEIRRVLADVGNARGRPRCLDARQPGNVGFDDDDGIGIVEIGSGIEPMVQGMIARQTRKARSVRDNRQTEAERKPS